MNREEIKKYVKDNCYDFLNYEGGERKENGQYYEGFYIEIEDIIDIILKLKDNKDE